MKIVYFIFLFTSYAFIVLGISIYANRLASNTNVINFKNPFLSDIPNQNIQKSLNLPTLTINGIFQSDHSWAATISAQHLRTIIATGDIIPARSVNVQTINAGDFTWAYKNTADILKTADITFANLESPLLASCQPTQEGMRFCGSPTHVSGLLFGGVDVVNLANNHMGNYGIEGIKETTKLLQDAGIQVTGRNAIATKDVRGLKFAFLGYNQIGTPEQGIAWVDRPTITKEIKQARQQADVVIVTFHWGTEYVRQPSLIQTELARLAIDSGADLIIGNHPHWIEPAEFYKGKLITYAHGNYIFDQMWSQETREGVLGRYTFYDKQLIDAEYLPIQIDSYGQPHFVNGNQKQRILQEMKTESEKLLYLK